MQHYDIDYFQLCFHLTLALDHLYRQSFIEVALLTTRTPLQSIYPVDLSMYLLQSLPERRKPTTDIISTSTTQTVLISTSLSDFTKVGFIHLSI